MISVITPVYNSEKFIESCIEGVIEQKCPDVEHLILDGASTDGTVKIIQQYAEKYPHIHWISASDKGQSDAMNKGIALAQGEIIAILNVDDFYEPNTLNRVWEIFKTLSETSLVVGNCKVLNDRGKLMYINKPTKLALTDLLLGFEVNPHPVNPSAYFYHKSLHTEIGLYDVENHYTMDLDFLLKAVQVAKLVYFNETWGNYRYIEGTKTVNDVNSGEGVKRYQNILDKYTNNLPIRERIQVLLARNWLVKYLNIRIKYLFKYPQSLIPLLLKKIKSFFFRQTI